MKYGPLAMVTGWIAFAVAGFGRNWPQYRGPGAGGIDDSQPLPTTWNVVSGENIRWQTSIPGLAHAAPVIWGDRLYVATAVEAGDPESEQKGAFVTASRPQQWRLLALDKATGRVVWNSLGHEGTPRVGRHTKASHCNSTPATDGERIVALFGSQGLFCFDAAGRLRWQKDLGPMDSGHYKVTSAQYGFGSSPVIHDGKVVVQCDVQQGSFIAVFDLGDGREIWRQPRSDAPTWSTPTIVSAAGRIQIAVNGSRHTGGYDFRTGNELWRLDGGGLIPVPTPIFAGDLIYFTSAHGRLRPLRAIRADASGDITPGETGANKAAVAWSHDRLGNYMQTPIVAGGMLYACSDLGLVTCFDAYSGGIRYSERLSVSDTGYTASPVSDGRHLYFTSERGNVFVVPVGGAFSVLAPNSLGSPCLATPAISEGALFFRAREKIIAVGEKHSAKE